MEWMAAFTGVHHEQAIEAEVLERDAHRFGDLRCVRVLHLEPDPVAAAHEQQIELGTRVRPVKVRVAISVETATTSPPPPAADAGTATAARAGSTVPTTAAPGSAEAPKPRRYHGTVALDSARVGRDASKIADEVITHLVGLVGSAVRVTLEIEAEIPSGAPDNVVRTVTENSRTLKFTTHGFETE